MIWDASQIQLFVDDELYFTKNIDNTLPFNKDFFFIFNVAVGGDWPHAPDGTTQFPQRMVVDYIRVFQ
jgi:beta-glucanase (GH16 family)